MSASQRRKGATGELEAAELLRLVYPYADRRPMQARGAKRDGCEVEGTPWWVEVKSSAAPRILPALRQAERDIADREDHRSPLVMAKTTRRGWTVTLRYADFAALVSEGIEARRALIEMAKKLLCAKPGCRAEPVLPGAWCVFHEPYDDEARAAGVWRVAQEGE
jgi:hypothetical protein